ncbi:MAG: hypothetical protein SH857_05840 [Chitinophagales bacterium]|nr:hypothetical protein [Chitinophagales bacterium]
MNARVRDFLVRGNFKIGVSVDSLKKDVYESIRLNASFDRVMENIRYFADYSARRNKTLTISICVMRQNWWELPDFINFSNSIGAMATFHKVMTPLQYAIHNLPQAAIQHIYDELSAYQFPTGSMIERTNKEHYENYTSLLCAWSKDAGWRQQQEPADLQKLTIAELLNHFTSNLRTYILEQNMIEKDRGFLIQTSEKRINNVLGLFENDQLRKAWLLLLCAIPMPNIFPAIKNLTTEKLYELSLIRIKDNQQDTFLTQ